MKMKREKEEKWHYQNEKTELEKNQIKYLQIKIKMFEVRHVIHELKKRWKFRPCEKRIRQPKGRHLKITQDFIQINKKARNM